MKHWWFHVVALVPVALAQSATGAPTPNTGSISMAASAAAGASGVPEKSRTFVSLEEIAGRIAQAEAAAKANKQYRGSPLLQSGPFRASFEYHTGPADHFAVHDNDAELFIVLDGSGTISIGGALVNPARNGANQTAAKAVGTVNYHVKKGEAVLVPRMTPHAVTKVDGRALVLMSLHLPHPAPAGASPDRH